MTNIRLKEFGGGDFYQQLQGLIDTVFCLYRLLNMPFWSSIQKRPLLGFLVCLPIFLILFASTNISALEPPWREGQYAHYANNEPLSEVLQHFATDQNIPIIVSEKITDKVNANFQNMPPKVFLERLASIYDLVWFYDGRSLYVSHLSESESRIISLKNMDVETAKQQLIELGLWDKKFNWRPAPKSQVVYVSGPPTYVSLIEESIELLSENYDPSLQVDYTAKIFRLKYALAVDRRVSFRGREEIIPGVATILRQTFGIADLGRKQTEKQQGGTASDYNLEKLKGKLSLGGENKTADQEKPKTNDVEKLANDKTQLTSIRALGHLNAVIVYAKKSDLALYEETIKSLDVPTDQIEIEVSIIDMSADLVQALGIDWQLQEAVGGQVNLSTIYTRDVGRFMLRVSALEEEGDARIISRPAVLTMNNEEATFDNSETFYVKLAGTEEVDLVPVSVGSLLQVRPRIISSETDKRAVRLDIRIEDGSRQSGSQSVENLPITEKTLITSQAEVAENESLLLGGHYYEQTVRSDRKVPLLGDLPFAGFLFRRDAVSTRKFVRIFMITPRIVGSRVHTGADAQARALNLKRRSELPADFFERQVDDLRIPRWQDQDKKDEPVGSSAPEKNEAPAAEPEGESDKTELAHTKPAPMPPATEQKQPPAAKLSPAVADGSRIKGWRLQSAYFEQKSEAEAMVSRLNRKGYQTLVRPFDHQAKILYRLETKDLVSESRARQLQFALYKQEGLETTLLPVTESFKPPGLPTQEVQSRQAKTAHEPRAAELPDQESWILQLGIFSSQNNAENLLKKLHKAGYKKANLIRDDSEGQLSYTVGINNLSRQRAESMQVDIRESLKVSGYIAPQR